MRERFNAVKLALPILLFLSGCSAPSATLELISVARKGVASAREAQLQQHGQLVERFRQQTAAMDDAFDADVRLVAAGQVADADGNPIEFSPQWVISARKGYSFARGIISEEIRKSDTVNAVRMDNLKVSDEALDLASKLIVEQSSLSQQIKQQMLDFQRILIGQ